MIDRAALVRVWCVPLAASAEALTELETLLSGAEVDRANRFARRALRDSYVAGRGMLRCLLAAELNAVPGELEITEGHNEKPVLAGSAAGPLHFNVSHSGGYWAAAVAWGQEIGVDIEAVRPMSDMEAIARRFFSAAEVSDLMSLPETSRAAAFFRCWTRKESFLKATGDGLAFGLDRFRVSLLPGVPAAILEMDGGPPPPDWRIRNLDLRDRTRDEVLSGALCWHGPDRQVELRVPASVEDLLAECG